MNRDRTWCNRLPAGRLLALTLALFLGALLGAYAQTAATFNLNVVDEAGTPVTAFRWLLQEDTTVEIVPGDPLKEAALSHGFHTSYAPVVAKGDQANAIGIPIPDAANKRYFVSVLPASGHTMSGAPVPRAGGAVEVKVHRHPIPTAQISVFVFEDNFPINNAPDQPQERGLAGFKVKLEDAGGRYGISAGDQMMDAFGNPIGTVYGQNGGIVRMGEGVVTTDADGYALIQNLAPGKYGVTVTPPVGEGWHQTATIEGKKVIDAWVKPAEPPFFVEFGPPGVHVFVGFVKAMNDSAFFTGSTTITGRVVNLHNSRPPNFAFWPGHPIPGAWVGLNSAPAGTGRGVYAAPCNADSTFSIPNVPEGVYELVIWDDNLDVIFATKNVTVPASGTLDLGDVAVFNWFGRLETAVFEDADADGFWDPGEVPIPEQVVNIRWRDGSVYQSMPTDLEGQAPFEEVFPFFNWLVAEVDFTRYKATGATIVVDAGGQVLPDQGWTYPSRGVLTPQPQYAGYDANGVPFGPITNPNTGNNLSRTEIGPVLTQAFQLFLGQTNVIEFGKAPYGSGQNGGISGITHYATTRAENDPALAVAEPWEPGIPRVQVNLYRYNPAWDPLVDPNRDNAILDSNSSGAIELADVDNHPFQWTGQGDPAAPGYTGTPGAEDVDHNGNGTWDQGDAIQVVWTDSWDDNPPAGAQGDNGPGFRHLDTFDGMRNFNQVRPGVFDGGYAFNNLPAGDYIVEAVAPPGYEHVKEEDKNVDFGDEYAGKTIPTDGLMMAAVPLDNQPIPIGRLHLVPGELALFPGVPAPYAGEQRPLPDRKLVKVTDGLNSACNFFLFTEVPVAGQIVGFILDDTANEFDLAAPAFGEKFSPPFIPVSIRDWAGNVIAWTVSDRYGAYNALVPSTYTANLPQPSGMSPNMITVVLNDPTNPDPNFPKPNPRYSQFSYTFQYMPGTTTYLDTPVVPIAAFAGPNQFPVDVEFPDGTPVVKQVDGGPYVAAPGATITIQSMGAAVQVANPNFGLPGEPQFITRDYSFGSGGTVTIGGVALTGVSWSADTITGTVADGTPTGQLVVTRSDTGKSSLLGITVTVGPLADGPAGPRTVRYVAGPNPPNHTAIQDAIDAANPGDLILIAPGTYEELVILHKPVQLQGWGAGAVFINAVQAPAEKIQNWRNKIQALWTSGAFDLLPAQTANFAGLEPFLAPVEGAGISVWARNTTQANGGFGPNPRARIDGLTVEGASTGGGIFVNGYARYLEVSNLRVRQNAAFQGGGITVGHPTLVLETAAGLEYQDAQNDHIRIHHNHIYGNGGLSGAGGGVALYTGAHFYEVTDNLIVGNFMQDNGGGIGHLGRSVGGLIARNRVLFNQSFNQGLTVSGGGIFIAGAAPLFGATVSPGSGPVTVDGNLIQGNLAGAGDGGGIYTHSNLPGETIRIINNLIVNNVAGLAGGGIAMQDTADIRILHNTVARNDSTATAGVAFSANPNQSTPQPAGIVSREHSPAFQALTGATFSNPVLDSNIIWQNRSFYFWIDPANALSFGLTFTSYRDLEVLPPTAGAIPVGNNLLNVDPASFVAPYFNGPKDPTIIQPEFTTIQAMPAFDEGGNFIDVRFGPLSVVGTDYHLAAALDGGAAGLTDTDLDGDLADGLAWIGADRYTTSTNAAPVAAGDGYTIELITGGNPPPFTVAAPGVLANDFDPDGGALSVTLAAGPGSGTLTLNPDGSFTYTPVRGFTGTVTFTYLASDGARACLATVTITVTARRGNEPPNPTAADINTQINTTGYTRVLPNDPDVGDTHTYNLQRAPRRGTATVTGTGTVIYDPNPNYLGTDNLVVRVIDQFGRGANVTVNIVVSLQLPPSQDLVVQLPPDTDGIDTDGDNILDNDHVYYLLGAGDGFTTMADGYEQYTFGFHDLSYLLPSVGPADPPVRTLPLDLVMLRGMMAGEWPAPTLKAKQGQKVYLNVTNVGMHMRPDLFDAHSVHWHGFPQASAIFDGMPDGAIAVKMASNLTYYYNVVHPGTYIYHCHVEATEHMQMGMLGTIYVTPQQDNLAFLYPKADGTLFKGFAYNDGDGSTGYDLDFPIQIGAFDSAFHDASRDVQPLPFALMKDNYPMLNGRGYPHTIESGSLAPAPSNTVAVATVVRPPAPGTSRFFISGADLSMGDDVYNGLDLVFTSGALKGTTRRIQDYTVRQQPTGLRIEVIPAESLPQAPAEGDTLAIGRASQNVSSRIEASRGQRILLRISSVGITRYYTLASTLPMEVVGHNARLLRGPDGKDLYYTTHSVTLGGGETIDAIIDTADVAPGTYLLYTSNLNYLSNNQEDLGGMMTEIVIRP